jgi:hypothetical protein
MHAVESVEITGRVADPTLHTRVRAEFMEMPGLKLTIPQAARLFALDARCCAQVFDQLVAHGVLAAAGGMFMRADAGRRQA